MAAARHHTCESSLRGGQRRPTPDRHPPVTHEASGSAAILGSALSRTLETAVLSLLLTALAPPLVAERAAVELGVSFLDEHVEDDFTNLGSGFLGDHNFSNPPADRIDPLAPRQWKWWRNIQRPYGYAGERFQFGLGSKWTSEFGPGYDCGHPGDPCSFPGTFGEFCRAEAASRLAQGMNPRWDFWPEPGWPGVGGENPFSSGADFAFWLRECALGLRSAYEADPGYSRDDLTIVAPSLWQWFDIYRVMFLQDSAGCAVLQSQEYFGPSFDCDAGEPTPFGLLEYLDTHREDLAVSLVSAHQFYDYMVHFWPWLFDALETALDAETTARDLPPMEITVNEYIGPSYNLCAEPIGVPPESPDCTDPIQETDNFLRPGHTVKGLAALHGGAVESAVKACWTDPTTGLSGCNERALNGLLVADDSMDLRPVWHVYRFYGDLVGHQISQAGVSSTYQDGAEPFDPLGAVATRDDTLAEESYRALVGYSNLMYQPELEIPGNDVYESFQGPYRWIDVVDTSITLSGLDPDCTAATLFTTEISGADFVAPMPSTVRTDRGSHPIVAGALAFATTLRKNDSLLIELEDFSGGAGCLTDLDGDGQSDPIPDPVDLIFQDGFESGDTSRWSATGTS